MNLLCQSLQQICLLPPHKKYFLYLNRRLTYDISLHDLTFSGQIIQRILDDHRWNPVKAKSQIQKITREMQKKEKIL